MCDSCSNSQKRRVVCLTCSSKSGSEQGSCTIDSYRVLTVTEGFATFRGVKNPAKKTIQNFKRSLQIAVLSALKILFKKLHLCFCFCFFYPGIKRNFLKVTRKHRSLSAHVTAILLSFCPFAQFVRHVSVQRQVRIGSSASISNITFSS